jgi:hypothetical protein
MELPGRFGHPAWTTAIGTILSYGAILLAMFVVLFVIPFLLLSAV